MADSAWKPVDESAWKPVAESKPAPTPRPHRADELGGPAKTPDTWGDKFGAGVTGGLMAPITMMSDAVAHPGKTLMQADPIMGSVSRSVDALKTLKGAVTGDPETLGNITGQLPYALAGSGEMMPAISRGASTVGRVATAATKAAAPDVAIGAGKAAAGYGLGEILPHGSPLKYVLELPSAYSGMKQVGRGLKKGVQAGREAFNEPAPIAPGPIRPPMATPPAAPVEPFVPPTDTRWGNIPPIQVEEGIAAMRARKTGALPVDYGSAPRNGPVGPPSVDESLATIRGKLEQRGALKPGQHLGEEPGGQYNRFDDGGPSPVARAPQTSILKEIPTTSPLATNPRALEAARKMAKAMEKR